MGLIPEYDLVFGVTALTRGFLDEKPEVVVVEVRGDSQTGVFVRILLVADTPTEGVVELDARVIALVDTVVEGVVWVFVMVDWGGF